MSVTRDQDERDDHAGAHATRAGGGTDRAGDADHRLRRSRRAAGGIGMQLAMSLKAGTPTRRAPLPRHLAAGRGRDGERRPRRVAPAGKALSAAASAG